MHSLKSRHEAGQITRSAGSAAARRIPRAETELATEEGGRPAWAVQGHEARITVVELRWEVSERDGGEPDGEDAGLHPPARGPLPPGHAGHRAALHAPLPARLPEHRGRPRASLSQSGLHRGKALIVFFVLSKRSGMFRKCVAREEKFGKFFVYYLLLFSRHS